VSLTLISKSKYFVFEVLRRVICVVNYFTFKVKEYFTVEVCSTSKVNHYSYFRSTLISKVKYSGLNRRTRQTTVIQKLSTSPRHIIKPASVPQKKYDERCKIINWSQLWPEAKELEALVTSGFVDDLTPGQLCSKYPSSHALAYRPLSSALMNNRKGTTTNLPIGLLLTPVVLFVSVIKGDVGTLGSSSSNLLVFIVC
jgi:hypothetical protein